ncbi:MAG: hypothetical protein ICV52_09075, partial [Microcoleus sp. C1-bin4]|nr:hypothetical protein [Microcoleus sp. C1-bin4]
DRFRLKLSLVIHQSATFRRDSFLLPGSECDAGRKYLSQDRGTPIRPPSATPYNDNCTSNQAIASTAVIIFNAGN